MTAAGLVKVARSQVGKHEHPIGSNQTKFGKWYGMDGYSWCDIFVSWCAFKAGLADSIGKFAYTPSHVNYFKEQKRWHAGTAGIQAGDIVFFNFDSDVGPEHVGIAIGPIKNGLIPTIEGNTSPTSAGSQANGDGVYEKSRAPELILGYGRPIFESHQPVKKFTITGVKVIEKVVREDKVQEVRAALKEQGYMTRKEPVE